MAAPPAERARNYKHPIQEALEVCCEVFVYAVITKHFATYVRISKKEFREQILAAIDPEDIEYRLDEEGGLYIR